VESFSWAAVGVVAQLARPGIGPSLGVDLGVVWLVRKRRRIGLRSSPVLTISCAAMIDSRCVGKQGSSASPLQ
jgi:hypothetical protein